MTSIQRHIIHRQILDVEVAGSEADGLTLQRRLADGCQARLGLALGEALDRFSPGDEHWTIDLLEVDAGRLALENFERDFVETVMQALERQLKERAVGADRSADRRGASPDAAARATADSPRERSQPGLPDLSGVFTRRTDAQSVQEAFVYFLATGILPWWFQLSAGKTLEDAVLASWQTTEPPARFVRALRDALVSADVRTRLVRQFSEDLLGILLANLTPASVAGLAEILAEIRRNDPAPEMFKRLSEELWLAAFAQVASNRDMTAESVISAWLDALPAGTARQVPHLIPRLTERIRRMRPGTKSRDNRAEVSVPSAGDASDEHDVASDVVAAVSKIVEKLEGLDLAPDARRRLAGQMRRAASVVAASGRRLTAGRVVAEWRHALEAGAERPEQRLIERIAQLWPATPSPDRRAEQRSPQAGDAVAARRDDPTPHIDLGDGVHVECAGLVLLHPFLPRLFEALGIAKADKLIQPDRALCLLHFLATGARRAAEYELLLPKLLCGLPLETPVDAPVTLTAAEEEEATALLEAVIRHWESIGNTSVEGLRGSFLVRLGRLFQRNSGDDVLQVEARSIDILLDGLPWSIAMIQLPWMRRLLQVEWRF